MYNITFEMLKDHGCIPKYVAKIILKQDELIRDYPGWEVFYGFGDGELNGFEGLQALMEGLQDSINAMFRHVKEHELRKREVPEE